MPTLDITQNGANGLAQKWDHIADVCTSIETFINSTKLDNANVNFSSGLSVANSKLASGATIGNLTLADGSITCDGSTITFGAENLNTTGTLSAGAITGTGFTIGVTTINQANLSTISGVTAGTVTGDKALVVNGDKDIASLRDVTARNLTLTEELTAATLDISGNVDVDGVLEADAITIGTYSLDALYSPIAGSSSIVTTGALNSGSITSGFGTINTGSSTITTTGEISAGSLTSTGVLSVDSTTDSTSTTTGSIHTDGGLGVVKDAYFGDDVNVNGSIATTDNNVSNTANTGRLSFEGSNVTQLGAWGADTSTGGILKFTTRSSDSSVNNVGIVIDGSGDVAIGTTDPAGALSVYGISRFSRQDSTPTGTANTVMNDAVFGSIETADTGITILGTGQIGIAFGNAASTEIGQIRYQHSSNAMEFRTNGNTAMTIDSAGSLLINDTVNTNMDQGLTINQGASDKHAFALKSSDVTQGGDFWDSEGQQGAAGRIEADTFFSLAKRHASYGGTEIRSYSESGSSIPFVIKSTGGAASTTKSASGGALINLIAEQVTGSGELANVPDNGNVLSVQARRSDANTTLYLLDVNGDSWQSGGATFADELTVTSATNATGIVIENTNQSPTLTFESGHANAAARDWEIITNQDSFGDFQIRVGASQGAAPGTKVLAALLSGYVGIGTVFPDNLLELETTNDTTWDATLNGGQREYGNSLILSNESTTTNSFSQLCLKTKAGGTSYARVGGVSTGSDATALAFGTESGSDIAERMRITATGFVGIGTVNPDDKLHVVGSLFLEDGSPEITFETTSVSNPHWQIAVNESVAHAFQIASRSASVDASGNFMDGGTVRMLVKHTGEVGVGTSSPTALLSVGDGTNSYSAKALINGGSDVILDVTDGTVHVATWALSSKARFGTRSNHPLWFAVNDSEKLVITDAGLVGIGDEVNTKMTVGLTINQEANDDEIQAWKSSVIDHGMTARSDTNTYGSVQKAHATGGGLLVRGFTDSHADDYWALRLEGYLGEDARTTKSTSGRGVISLDAYVKDPLGTGASAVGTNGNLVSIETASTVRFIFDAEGSGHADVEWTTYDKHDDLSVIRDMEMELLAHEDASQTSRRHYMESTGIIGQDSWHMENGKPKAMVNFTKLSMLHHGALIQIGDRFISNEERINYQQEEINSLKQELRLLKEAE